MTNSATLSSFHTVSMSQLMYRFRDSIHRAIRIELENEYQERISALHESNDFLGQLYKRIHKDNQRNREKILEDIEACFVELDQQYSDLDKWYYAERGRFYGYFRNKIT